MMAASALIFAGLLYGSHALDAPCRMSVNNGDQIPLDTCLADSFTPDSDTYQSRMHACVATDGGGYNVEFRQYDTADCTGTATVAGTTACISNQLDVDEFCFCGDAYALCSAYENRVVYDECDDNLYGRYIHYDQHVHADCYPYPTSSASAPFAKSQMRNCTTMITYSDTDCQTVESVEDADAIVQSQCVRYTVGCANPPTKSPTPNPTEDSSVQLSFFVGAIVSLFVSFVM